MTNSVAVPSAPPIVLVVDNDPLVRLGTIVMLRESGFAPVSARDGQTALAMINGGVVPALLVTDYDMPGMTGLCLAQAVTALHETVKVLVVTGHSALGSRLAPGWAMLSKPFTSNEVRDALANLGITAAHKGAA